MKTKQKKTKNELDFIESNFENLLGVILFFSSELQKIYKTI